MQRSLLLVMVLWLCGGGARSATAPDSPSRSPAPNILLIVVDTLRSDRLGCYGHDRETSPHLDRLAERGVRYERCYATSSWTLPSCASLLSGLYPAAHGAEGWSSAVGPDVPWLPSILHDAGYHTAGVSSNPFLTAKQGIARGFDVFDDQTVLASAEWSFPLLKSKHRAVVMASTASTATRRAMEILNERPTDQPLFLLVHYMDCHADYVPPAPWDTRFDPDYAGKITGHVQSRSYGTDLPARDVAHIAALYDGEVAHVDDHIGRLLAHVEALDLTEQTLVIVTADHGEELLEHGAWGHGHTLYEEAVRVPLIMAGPSITPQRRVVSDPVSLVDVMPTLGSLVGVPMPAGHGLDLSAPPPEVTPEVTPKSPPKAAPEVDAEGAPLAASKAGLGPDRPVFMETRLGVPLRAMVRGSRKTIAEVRDGPDGPTLQNVRVFDLKQDAAEKSPAAADAAAMHDAYQHIIGATEFDDVATPSEVELDHAELQRLRSLGYIGGGDDVTE
jgi:arylsulfatase A-like enzyme